MSDSVADGWNIPDKKVFRRPLKEIVPLVALMVTIKMRVAKKG